MKHKLNCVLLIDDNEADNFLHKMIIEEADITEKIVIMENGQTGLDYLLSSEGGAPPPT